MRSQAQQARRDSLRNAIFIVAIQNAAIGKLIETGRGHFVFNVRQIFLMFRRNVTSRCQPRRGQASPLACNRWYASAKT